jgi:hypothetical protein
VDRCGASDQAYAVGAINVLFLTGRGRQMSCPDFQMSLKGFAASFKTSFRKAARAKGNALAPVLLFLLKWARAAEVRRKVDRR